MELFRLFGTIAINNSEANKALDDTTSKAKSFGDKLTSTFGKIGDTALKVAKVGAVAVTTVATGLAAMTKSAVESYADYEQLVGGVETLFKESSKKVMEYADNAYKTAGLSANEYMETVTSFSASLLQGLGGDTEKAANIADTAITDMSDNANKMGTSMSMIQDAYQGFAKQNYTMLDNLKLGYGGTQAEMARLINDSGVLGDTMEVTAKTVNEVSFDKIIEAIHVIQTEMGITGTTAKEAASTISGSISTMKSAWSNFLTGMADSEQDFDRLLNNLIDSVVTVADNIVPRIVETLPRLVEGLTQLFNRLLPYIPPLLESLIPAAIQGLVGVARAVLEALPGILEEIFPGIGGRLGTAIQNFMSTIADFCVSMAPQIVSAFETVLNIITSVLEWINGLDEGTKQFILTAAALVVGLSPVISIIGQVISAGSGLIGGIAKVVTSGGNLLGTITKITSVGSVLSGGITKIIGLVTSLLGGIGNLVVAVGSKLIAALSSINPIVAVVVAAIAALIAIGVALYKNWDEICAWASETWTAIKETIGGAIDAIGQFFTGLMDKAKELKENISEKFNELKENVVSKVEELRENAVAKFEELKERAVSKFEELKERAATKFEELRERAVNKFEELKENATAKVEELKEKAVSKIEDLKERATEKLTTMQQKGTEIVEGLKSKALEGFENLKSGALERFENLKSGITDKLEGVKSFVGDAAQRLKDFFNFDWDLPKIKLPHFSISGNFSLNPPSIPSFGIEWYKDGGIMNDPTMFGFNPFSNKAMVGGEAGPEAIAPISTLQSYVRDAVSETNNKLYTVMNAVLSVLTQYLPELAHMQVVMDTGETVGVLATPMSEKLGKMTYMRERTN